MGGCFKSWAPLLPKSVHGDAFCKWQRRELHPMGGSFENALGNVWKYALVLCGFRQFDTNRPGALCPKLQREVEVAIPSSASDIDVRQCHRIWFSQDRPLF